MKLIQISLLLLLLCGLAFAQDVRLSYQLVTGEEGTTVEVYAESYTDASVDLAALNLSLAYNAGCEAVGEAQSILTESWTDYLTESTVSKELKLNHSELSFTQRLQWGSADPGLPQTSIVTIAPASATLRTGEGTRTLILTQDFKGACQDLYLEHVSENPLNELGDVNIQPMSYVIEHPNRPVAPELDFAISAFPNPTTEMVTVEAEGLEAGSYTLRMTDLRGRLIMKENRVIDAATTLSVSLDIRKEAAGVYILDLSNDMKPLQAKATRVVKE